MNNWGEGYVKRLRAASRSDYAIGSFNLDSLDVLGELATRAAATRTPIIFQLGHWSVARLTIGQLGRAAKAMMDPAAGGFIHIDHCTDVDFIRQSLGGEFDSVMFDGSGMPLDENIAATREVVNIGHDAGAAVEGAVGIMEKGADTRLADARRFVEETGVDALGVAIGTGHGQQKDAVDIDLGLLRELSTLDVPLVIHGGSGLPEAVTAEVCRTAVAKVNVATASYRSYKAALAALGSIDQLPAQPSGVTGIAADAFWEVIRERIERFGCLGVEAAP